MSIAIGERKNVSTTFTATGNGESLGVDKENRYTISIAGLSGTGSTIILERLLEGSTWRTYKSYTVDAEEDGIAHENMFIRFRCTFMAGSIIARLGK